MNELAISTPQAQDLDRHECHDCGAYFFGSGAVSCKECGLTWCDECIIARMHYCENPDD